MAVSVSSLLFVLFKPCSKLGPRPFKSSTLLPTTSGCQAAEPRKDLDSANFLAKDLQKCAQSGTDYERGMVDEKKGPFADERCASMEDVELILTVAHKTASFLVYDSLEKSLETFWYSEAAYQLLHCARAD